LEEVLEAVMKRETQSSNRLLELADYAKEPTIPNRLDDHMGEIANVQQLHPEIVIGYIVIFNVAEDSRRRDGVMWSDFFESAINKIAIRKAPLWNQGLLEASWFVRFDSRQPFGSRISNPEKVDADSELFFRSLIAELRLREPAIPFSAAAPPRPSIELE
jgi:hypothetical protein